MMTAFQIWLFLISQCIEAAEKKCGPNEWYDKCGTLKACEDKCNEDENEERNEEACLSRACPGPGVCMCDPGFYRNKNGKCVSKDDCEYDNMEFITFAPCEERIFHKSALC
ncbi:trypsin Inhibitor like cysteine rich domain protein [Ancylostoma caninum]|uniref:Trypsin Inhibitor like cysteine rich domain protein n=1 Tax=Ancylostoma caninum TaxID=29170 RepID=A0A368G5P2_ANCCA|nr:trypsin Inhibitor like cysteine rich domain protein [Ancylostoma caninum]